MEMIVALAWIVIWIAWMVVMGWAFWSWNKHTREEVQRQRIAIIHAYLRPRDGGND